MVLSRQRPAVIEGPRVARAAYIGQVGWALAGLGAVGVLIFGVDFEAVTALR